MTRIGAFFLAGLALAMAACLTINVYFPAAAVQNAADEFVGDVTDGATAAPAPTPSPQKKQSSLSIEWVSSAWAQEQITIHTVQAQKLKGQMRQRLPQVQALKAKGQVGENNQGFLEARDVKGISDADQAELKKVMKAENSDRQALYKEIAKVNHYPKSKMSELQAIFAKAWQSKSLPGSWIQQADGQWLRK